MLDKQFVFSLVVSVVLIALGSLIAGKATVGISLIALGAAIAALAVFTWASGRVKASNKKADSVVGLLPRSAQHS